MDKIKASLLHRNKQFNISPDEKKELGDYLEIVKSFAKITYQSVYVIDYETMKFEFVSDNPLFLCGLTSEEVLAMGYDFYFKNVPPEDLEMLSIINLLGFDFYDRLPNNDDRKLYSISYDFRIKGKYDNPILINHKLTPLFLTAKGAIWKSLCIVSVSSNKLPGNVVIDKQNSDKIWRLDFSSKVWIEEQKIKLSERELENLRLFAQGLSISQIAERLYLSPETIKYHRKKICEAFDVKNFTEALSYAIDKKML